MATSGAPFECRVTYAGDPQTLEMLAAEKLPVYVNRLQKPGEITVFVRNQQGMTAEKIVSVLHAIPGVQVHAVRAMQAESVSAA